MDILIYLVYIIREFLSFIGVWLLNGIKILKLLKNRLCLICKRILNVYLIFNILLYIFV